MAILNGVEIIKDGEGKTIKIGSDFSIVKCKITESYSKEIKRFLDGEIDNFQSVKFDEDRKIYHRGGNSLIVEYTNKDLRDKDVELHNKHFQKDRKYFSKELEGGFQIGEVDGLIDYKGKYYLILDGLNKLVDKIDDIVFKGIIVNPAKYFETNIEIQKVGSRVRDIMIKK